MFLNNKYKLLSKFTVVKIMIFRVVNPVWFGDSTTRLPPASAAFLFGLQFHPEDGGCMLLRITRRYSPNDRNLHSHGRENFKSDKFSGCLPVRKISDFVHGAQPQ